MTLRAPGLALAALVLAAPPAGAIGSAERGDASIEATGSMRLMAAYLHYPDVPLFFPDEDGALAAGVTRLLLDGDLGPLVDYEVNLYADLSYLPANALSGAFATAGSFDTPYRTTYLSWDFWRSGGMHGQLGIDRLAFNLEVDRISLTLGRSPINLSVTSIFAPNDFFAPFTVTAVNKIYKPGVDSIRLSVRTGVLSSVEVLGVMGHDAGGVPAWGRSAVLARLATVLGGFEWSLLGGRVAGRWIAGASIQGGLGIVTLRAEAHAGFPDGDGDGRLEDVDGDGGWRDDVHGRLAAGLDLNLAWRNLTIGAEYMFLSDGALGTSGYLARLTRFFPDDQPFLGRHYVGLVAGLDIVPILRLTATGLFNATDASGLAALVLAYSISDEADALVGVFLPWGDRPVEDSGPPFYGPAVRSEFGLVPIMLFIEMRFYF
jgi:hypothetical protein